MCVLLLELGRVKWLALKFLAVMLTSDLLMSEWPLVVMYVARWGLRKGNDKVFFDGLL